MAENILTRAITVEQIREALNLIVAVSGMVIEEPAPPCEWPQLCHEDYCRFPRYYRDNEPLGLVSRVLLRLDLPVQLLKNLDTEYEISEVLHPGVKISRSRNPVLRRFDTKGMALLQFIQDHQKVGWSWRKITDRAFESRWALRRFDLRRRPWLY